MKPHLLLIALLVAGACDRPSEPTPTPPPTPTAAPTQSEAACVGPPRDGCAVIELVEKKADGTTYANFVKYDLPEGPKSLARPIRLGPGTPYTRSLARGHYGLLIYRQDAEPSAGEGPECQMNFMVARGKAVSMVVRHLSSGGCSVSSG